MKQHYLTFFILLITSMSYTMEQPAQKIGIDYLQLTTGELASAQTVINTIDRLNYLQIEHHEIFEDLCQNSRDNTPLRPIDPDIASELMNYGIFEKEKQEITDEARRVIVATTEPAKTLDLYFNESY